MQLGRDAGPEQPGDVGDVLVEEQVQRPHGDERRGEAGGIGDWFRAAAPIT
jgi:hypothetical protein